MSGSDGVLLKAETALRDRGKTFKRGDVYRALRDSGATHPEASAGVEALLRALRQCGAVTYEGHLTGWRFR